jgi:hypothetical protein
MLCVIRPRKFLVTTFYVTIIIKKRKEKSRTITQDYGFNYEVRLFFLHERSVVMDI